MFKPVGSGQPFKQAINIPKAPSPEVSPWFWNPNRVGVTFGPEWFRSRLHEIDPELEVTWDRHNERWLVWVKQPRLQSKLCSGWMLLFPVRYEDGSYMPLDERTLARIYAISAARWDGAKRYFDAIEREWERDREIGKRKRDDAVQYSAGEYYDYMKIKTGYGESSGSKFQKHWS